MQQHRLALAASDHREQERHLQRPPDQPDRALEPRLFQATVAIITPAPISGAVVERMNFRAWMVFVTLWSTVVYLTLRHRP